MSILFGKGREWSLSSSRSHNPFFNLAWENELLHGEFEGESHLFLYRNGPCIVSGRFQVPWREMNFLHENQLPYVRRRSGGGTVYHDLGNWNFCFVHKGRELKREENLKRVIGICASLGISLSMNERFDLTTTQGGSLFKVSGSAFKQKKDYALHHGTLLVKAGIDQLKGALGVTSGWKVTGKGIPSVPSPVLNLERLDYDLWEKSWCESLAIGPLEMIDTHVTDRFRQEESDLRSWQWRFGETPHHSLEFSWELGLGGQVELDIQKGRVISYKNLPPEINLIGLKVGGESEEKIKDINKLLARALEGHLGENNALESNVRRDLLALFSDRSSILF